MNSLVSSPPIRGTKRKSSTPGSEVPDSQFVHWLLVSPGLLTARLGSCCSPGKIFACLLLASNLKALSPAYWRRLVLSPPLRTGARRREQAWHALGVGCGFGLGLRLESSPLRAPGRFRNTRRRYLHRQCGQCPY